jgi:putative ABC transport system permease protein
MRSAERLAVTAVRAHWTSMTGTALVIALAAALVTLTGVLVESGLREPSGGGALLIALASSFAGTALVVVVLVVASTLTLALRRRRRELALLTAIGATRAQVRRMISAEILLVSAVAAPLGAVPGLLVAHALDPQLRAAGVVDADHVSTVSPLPVLAAVLVVVPTALLAGRLAARETTRVEPTEAIRLSTAETTSVGRVRRVASVVLALAGLAASFSALTVPGATGSALAASSAFLLVGAAALAGPVLVEWTLRRVTGPRGGRTAAPVRLAAANLRGFSRRLTAVVVPLALLLAVGTTQTTVDRVLRDATTSQLEAAIGTELVATSERGLTEPQLARLRGTPGVSRVVPLGEVEAQVRTDDDGDLPDALVWETTALRVVPPATSRTDLDPDVTRGDLARLSDPETVAVSEDTAFETGAAPGDRLRVRVGDDEADLRVVAVYSRGLGLGDQLIGPGTATRLGTDPVVSTALVGTTDGPRAAAGVADAASASTEADVAPTASYVRAVTSPDAAGQRLSTILTLLLLVFVGLGSANALVHVTVGRGPELRLLHQGGATPRQLLGMVGVESVVTGVAAWVIGTVAVLPGVVGTSAGLLGFGLPHVDVVSYAVLSLTVVGLAVVATVAPAASTVRAATRLAR